MSRVLLSFFVLLSGLAYSQLTPIITVDTSLGCDVLTVQFDDVSNQTGVVSRLWDFGDGDTDTSISISHTYDMYGVYTASLTLSSLTETKTTTEIITVRQKPIAEILSSKYANYTLTDTLYFSYGKLYHKSISEIDSLDYNYTWVLASDTLVDTTSAVVKQYNKLGKYNVSLIVTAFGTCADSTVAEVSIEEANFLPNIFTPNGDGQNDIFYAQTDGITAFELTIFSRYGSIVYISKGTKVWWDGRNSAGEEVVPGTYYYVLQSQSGDQIQKGTVFLSR